MCAHRADNDNDNRVNRTTAEAAGQQRCSRPERSEGPAVAVTVALFALFLLAVPLRAQDPVTQLDLRPAPDSALIARIVAEGTTHSRARETFATLLDVIGPRLTGSPALRRANDWTAAQMRAAGADSAWLEPWSLSRSWTRGRAVVRMLAPQERVLVAASVGWTPGTNGPARGDVVWVDTRTPAEFDAKFAGRLRGAWVMVTPAIPVANPEAPLDPPARAKFDSTLRAHYASIAARPGDLVGLERLRRLMSEGVAGVLVDGEKPNHLLVMRGSPANPLLPQVMLAHESYAQVQRLLARGEKVRIEADIANTLLEQPAPQWNTVAEIRGSEHPDEVVLLGAHLDSWDLGTGATDNGAGVVAVMEAARILAATGVRPKRTIRFVLFSGEEQGLLGSSAYARDHASALPHIQAAMMLDNGTGRITGVPLQGRNDLSLLWRRMLDVIPSQGPFTIEARTKGGSDHLPFLNAGVPAYLFIQDWRGYDHTYHSQDDVLDYTWPGDVAQAATVMAAAAWQLANLPVFIPRGTP
ncbi:MAG: hypothetical protein JWO05_3277 [Gemmatimonadetes bacterium]|nr:hypothetical protein [Gemmatimonadota bacterium]